MKYNALGSTGLSVSEIALGCEGFNGKSDEFSADIFRIAFEHGVNFMDLYSPNPQVHRQVGRAIGERRADFILQAHLCTVWQDGQYKATRQMDEIRGSFEAMLENLDTDYVDIGMIHYVDSLDLWHSIARGEIMAYAREQQAMGRIKHIGLSSHNPIVALEAVRSGLIEVLMFSVNPCYDLLPGDEDVETLWAEESYAAPLLNMDPDRQELYETCQRMGVGMTVMKVFGGGDLLNEYSPAGATLTVPQCIHYALTRPGAASVMAGFKTPEELLSSLAYCTAPDAERDYAAALAAFPKISWKGHCMYCGHCAPCPQGIDVAMVTKLLNLTKAQGELPETVREHYASLAAHAGDCVACGACESRCPFEVEVIMNMGSATAVFGR